jgi:splicing factor 3B subunit 4
MLAKQAKAHGVAPAVQPLPAHLFQAPPQSMPVGVPQGMMSDGRGMGGAPNGPSGGYGRPPPMAMAGGPPSLPPAPSGLPARPPSGAPPTNFYAPPPGFGGPPPNGPPGFGMPPGAPPGFGPPGFGPPR